MSGRIALESERAALREEAEELESALHHALAFERKIQAAGDGDLEAAHAAALQRKGELVSAIARIEAIDRLLDMPLRDDGPVYRYRVYQLVDRYHPVLPDDVLEREYSELPNALDHMLSDPMIRIKADLAADLSGVFLTLQTNMPREPVEDALADVLRRMNASLQGLCLVTERR